MTEGCSGQAASGTRARRRRDPREPVSVWREKEHLDGKLVDAGVMILRTSGCAHSKGTGCTMCGYNSESSVEVSEQDLHRQLEKAFPSVDGVGFLKVYTSGSFLDEREMPAPVRESVLRWCADRSARLLFESRAEFVTDESLAGVLALHDDIEVAIGLESANDRVLKYAINKDMTVAEFEGAAVAAKKAGAALRAYVLLKPPFLTEAEAVEDAKATIRYAAPRSHTISLNPVNVQFGTTVERLWKTWAYRPPWLWSVVEVLNACSDIDGKIVCDPTGGGKERGAHNCGGCDDEVLAAVRDFSLNQKRDRIPIRECACRDLWETVMELEGFVTGGTVDLERFSRDRRS